MAAVKDPTFELARFDYEVIAKQIKESRDIVVKGSKKTTTYSSPKLEMLSNAIVGVELFDTIEGSSTLTITLADPTFELFEFFDINHNGKLDDIELQYPPGGPNWWRLAQLGVSAQPGDALRLTLSFMERPAVLLLHKRGPKKTSRGKVTRAEFFRSLVRDVKAHPLKFHSSELHVKQRIEGTTPVQDDDRKSQKRKGIPSNFDGTVKNIKIKREQIKQANRLLDKADDLSAPEDAAVALIMTAIAESNIRDVPNAQGSIYSGVLQGSPANFDVHNTELAAKYCLQGGKGFNAPGGLIGGVKEMNKKGSTKYPNLAHLIVVNQGNITNFGSWKDAESWADGSKFNYDGVSEAEAIVAAYGGGFGGGSTYYRKTFFFQIGDEEHPKQRYWDGMTDLAKEVNWRLFVDGRTVYFDSDMTLISQVPAATIHRESEYVVGFDANWDGERHMATEMSLELICEPFEFRAGEVLLLKGFGPLSRGSTAKPKPLPGRWLIWEIERQSGSYSSTFTLRQPVKEKLEPETEIGEHEPGEHGPVGSSIRDVDNTMTPKEIIVDMVLPIGRKHHAYASGGGTLNAANVQAANNSHGPTSSGGTSDHQGNGVNAWAADMAFHGAIDSKDGDGLADELARKFNMTGGVRSNHVYDFGVADKTKDGLRYQLGWKVEGHHDHVHFGIKVVDPSKRKPTRESPNGPLTGGGPFGTGRLGP